MTQVFDNFQKVGQENFDATVKSFGVVSKGVQTLAAEAADFSKKSFDESSAVVEKLLGAKTLDKAIEIQTEYAKAAYEGFLAQANRFGEVFNSIAKEAYKPLEGALAKANTAAANVAK